MNTNLVEAMYPCTLDHIPLGNTICPILVGWLIVIWNGQLAVSHGLIYQLLAPSTGWLLVIGQTAGEKSVDR